MPRVIDDQPPFPPRPLRWTLAALLALTVGVVAPAPAPAAEAPAPPARELVVEGKGWGHGVGMSQDGAYAMGRDGASTAEILSHFYPGTTLGQGSGALNVVVLPAAGPATLLEFPDGGQVRDDPSGAQSAGFPIELAPGGRVEVSFDGANSTARAVSGFAGQGPRAPAPPPPDPAAAAAGVPVPPAPPAPPPGVAVSARTLTAHPRQGSTTVVLATGRRYRGVIRAAPAAGGLRLLNQIDVEQYLRGMGEVRDPSWPPAALQTQAIAARTYALRAMNNGGEICDTDRCQVYLGQTAEYAAMDQAVAATAGQVVVHEGALALTVYSASGGGVSATPEEGFGPAATALPYLLTAPYPTENPMAWGARIDLAVAARRLGYGGEATDIRVSRAGPSGRPLEVTVEGDWGPVVLAGQRFMSALNLRSNLFTVRVEGGAPPVTEPRTEDPPPMVEPAFAGALSAPSPPAERLAAEGSDIGSAAVLMTVLVLLVAWIGFRPRRSARPGGLP